MVIVYAKSKWISTGKGKRPVLFNCLILKDESTDDKIIAGISTDIDCCEIPYVELIFKGKRYKDYDADDFDEPVHDLLKDGRIVSISNVRDDDEVYKSMYDSDDEMNNKGLMVLVEIDDQLETLYLSAVNKHNGYYPHEFIIKYTWDGQKYRETGSL